MSILATSQDTLDRLGKAAEALTVEPRTREIGRVLSAGDGIARIAGLPSARAQELLTIGQNATGIAFNVDEHEIGCVLLCDDTMVAAGDIVRCTGEVVRTPVGKSLLGRVVDPLGNPLDGGPEIVPERFDPVEKEAPAILARAPVVKPLATGLKSVDAMIPIGRGQRELIIGDRSTGKTTIAIDAIINQVESGVICLYVAIGQRASSVARFIEALRVRGAMEHSVVVVADADSPPGMKFIAPYAGCTISEFFMEEGHDTLIAYDDLTKHAQTYREISLLLRRPPGREAYPGDVFFIHSRLLERATQMDEEHGGGSQTALPIIETQAQNISAYVPTNLISITDGQVYLSPELFQSGLLPAVDIGLSVSRVGGKTQIAAMKRLAQEMRLAYTQFLELEQFTKFGTTMEAETQAALEKGKRLRELLKQPEHQPRSLAEQVLLLNLAAGEVLNEVAVDLVQEFEAGFIEAAKDRLADIVSRIEAGDEVTEQDVPAIEKLGKEIAEKYREPGDGK
ncbi:MAG: F0F1 ATP synthase subunit alpha [Kiritimatiellia bacterium]|nr:F0F1 ATP synthase subunit alpha [Kiritimatiellia bacterium]MDP6848707.1 F0F1 ATP synthase subunit alpha [Kiritimatiellia bacterium]